MTTTQLQTIVATEGICLCLIILIMISAFKRWNIILYGASVGATIAFFSAWTTLMAIGSVLIYAPASVLLWYELDEQNIQSPVNNRSLIRNICWSFLAIGVAILIVKNIYNIYCYLS